MDAASSRREGTSGCSGSAEADHEEVIGPSIDFATAAALASPDASKRILRASRMVPIPMVIAHWGISSPAAKSFRLSSMVCLLRTLRRVLDPMLEFGSLKPLGPLRAL